jgi:hypothetical protein
MKLNAFWTGGDLSYVEQLCLSSAAAMGHDVDLWTYGTIGNAPKGVTLRDGREVMPESMMIWHKQKNSPAIGADIFRLLLQEQGRGCYIDCDMLFLKPLADADHIFGWQSADSINNAIIKLPIGSPILADLRALLAAKPVILPWWGPSTRLRQRCLGLVGRDRDLSELPWGSTGPKAITHFARKYGLVGLAKPKGVFYPLNWKDAEDIFKPAEVVTARITENTICVHLWNQMIRWCRNMAPLPGSFMWEQCVRFGVRDRRWADIARAWQ